MHATRRRYWQSRPRAPKSRSHCGRSRIPAVCRRAARASRARGGVRHRQRAPGIPRGRSIIVNDIARAGALAPALSEAAIAADEFDRMRAQNLARWPTGADVDFDEAVAFQRALPEHKRLAVAMRRAHADGRCLTQPRGGFATLAMQKELMQALDRDGLADIVPTTTDSYTRNEQFAAAQKGVDESERLGRSLLNGFPIVNYGLAVGRELVAAIDKPAILLLSLI